jgi:uncharacterized protein GlcG (DUF336 family)
MKLGLHAAVTMIEAAQEHAAAHGHDVTIAVVDDGGNLIAQHRMDGACLATLELSRNKAFSALAMFEATHSYAPRCRSGEPLFGIHAAFDGRLTILAGGLPVRLDGEFVGGVGVSGAPEEIDLGCGRAALAAIGAEPAP